MAASEVLGSPVNHKAAFNNLPCQYGIVERTYSQHKSGLLAQTLISSYGSLPDCQGLKTQRAVRQKFIKDYRNWLLYDVDGFRKLGASMTRWFQIHIATEEKEKGKKKDDEAEGPDLAPEDLGPGADADDEDKEDRKKGIINF